MELHTIELNKFTSDSSEELADIVAKTRTALDIWVAFLTRHDLLKADRLPKELDDKNLKKALHVLDVLNFSEEERELYEDHLKWLRIEANTLKKTAEKALAEGISIGESRGIEKGIEEGENRKAIEIALNLLHQNLPLDVISSATGLSHAELAELKAKL